MVILLFYIRIGVKVFLCLPVEKENGGHYSQYITTSSQNNVQKYHPVQHERLLNSATRLAMIEVSRHFSDFNTYLDGTSNKYWA